MQKKKWDDMTAQERLQSWELFALEMEGIIERRKKREEEIEKKKKEREEGKTTGE